IQLAQTVEDGAFDAVLGVRGEDDFLIGVVFARGVEEAEDAGVNQIVEIDVHGEVLVYADGDGFDKRKVLENHAVALGDTGALSGEVDFSAVRDGRFSFLHDVWSLPMQHPGRGSDSAPRRHSLQAPSLLLT